MRQWEFYRLDGSFYEQVDLILAAIRNSVLCGENNEENINKGCIGGKLGEEELGEAISCLHKFLKEMLLLEEEYFFSFLSQILLQRAEEKEIYLSPAEVQRFLQFFSGAASQGEKEAEMLPETAKSETEREEEKLVRLKMTPEMEPEAKVISEAEKTGEEAKKAMAETEKAAEDVLEKAPAAKEESANTILAVRSENALPGENKEETLAEASEGRAAKWEKKAGFLEWSLSVLFSSGSFQLLWENEGEAAFYLPEWKLVLWTADNLKNGKQEIAGKNKRERILVQCLGRDKCRQLQVIEVTAEEARNHHLLRRILSRAAVKAGKNKL